MSKAPVAPARRFRKRPVEIEAMQFDGTLSGYVNIKAWGGAPLNAVFTPVSRSEDPIMVVTTLEGDMIARTGDWIIRGVAGEFYPCREDIFAQTYEGAE